jgi:acetyl-CoA acetyltransferase
MNIAGAIRAGSIEIGIGAGVESMSAKVRDVCLADKSHSGTLLLESVNRQRAHHVSALSDFIC